MDSSVCWIGVAVLVGVGLIVPLQAEEGSLDVAPVHRASNACAVFSAFESAAATPQTPEEQTPEEWLDRCDANDNGRVTCAEARAEACGAPIPVTKDRRPVDGVYLSMGRRITRLSIRSTNGRRTFSLSRIQVVQHH